MPKNTSPIILPSEITPEHIVLGRRAFIARTAALAASGSGLLAMASREAFAADADKPTSKQDANHYNNFYEFSE